MSKRVLVNGRIVNEGRIVEADIAISDDRIERIGGALPTTGATVTDLAGRLVMPGVIDDQVHFREPGLTHKASIGSESLAAICGGVTSYLDMPNNSPPIVDREGLALKRRIAAETSHANYGFYLGATNDNIDAIRAVTNRDACGIKVFMGASTGNMLVDDERTLDRIFADATLLVATHCEDTPMIRAAEEAARRRFGEDVPIAEHPSIRSAEACLKSSSLAVELARRHGSRLHVLHLTTAAELQQFEAGPIEAKRITAEACVHHLWFDDSDYARLGTLIKCNPAIKTARDREALIEAVNAGVIDVIATDHAPHTLEEKAGTYFSAPAGLPLVQHMLPMLLEQHHRGVFSLETIVEKTAHNPARLFRIAGRGFVREGYFADLVVVDPAGETIVNEGQIRYRCGWSPLAGERLRASVDMTFLNGELVYAGDETPLPPTGRALEFG